MEVQPVDHLPTPTRTSACAQGIGASVDLIWLRRAPPLPAAADTSISTAITTATTATATTTSMAAATTTITTAITTATSAAPAMSASSTAVCAGKAGGHSADKAGASADLTIVCVKWGRKYGADYVNRLHRAVRQHLPSARSFVCLTDDPEGIRRVQGLRAIAIC